MMDPPTTDTLLLMPGSTYCEVPTSFKLAVVDDNQIRLQPHQCLEEVV